MTPLSGGVLLIAAMKAEGLPLASRLGLAPLEQSPYRFERWGKLIGGVPVVLSFNGSDARFGNERVGLETAALNAMDSIARFNPKVVVNVGTAGSFADAGAEVGKVYLSGRRFYFHDHRIPLAGYEEFGRGNLPGLDVTDLARELGLEIQSISSGSSLDYVDRDLETLRGTGAILKEMEAGAIAFACDIASIPFFAMKSVTNLIDVRPDSASEFSTNLDKAVTTLTDAAEKLVLRLTEMELASWAAERRNL